MTEPKDKIETTTSRHVTEASPPEEVKAQPAPASTPAPCPCPCATPEEPDSCSSTSTSCSDESVHHGHHHGHHHHGHHHHGNCPQHHIHHSHVRCLPETPEVMLPRRAVSPCRQSCSISPCSQSRDSCGGACCSVAKDLSCVIKLVCIMFFLILFLILLALLFLDINVDLIKGEGDEVLVDEDEGPKDTPLYEGYHYYVDENAPIE